MTEIIDIVNEKEIVDGSELLVGQEVVGGVDSTFKTTISNLFNFFYYNDWNHWYWYKDRKTISYIWV